MGICGAGGFGWGFGVGGYVSTQGTTIPVPTSLTTIASSATEFDLSWSAATGALGYLIERSTDEDFPEDDTTTIDLRTETAVTYKDTVTSTDTVYHYRARAVGGTACIVGGGSAKQRLFSAPTVEYAQSTTVNIDLSLSLTGIVSQFTNFLFGHISLIGSDGSRIEAITIRGSAIVEPIFMVDSVTRTLQAGDVIQILNVNKRENSQEAVKAYRVYTVGTERFLAVGELELDTFDNDLIINPTLRNDIEFDCTLNAGTTTGEFYLDGNWEKILDRSEGNPSLLPLSEYSTAIVAQPILVGGSTSFVTTWEVETANDEITFPGFGTYRIHWGDGSEIETVTVNVEGDFLTHEYATAKSYTITVSNSIIAFLPNEDSGPVGLINVNQWGTAIWSNMNESFASASKMRMDATDNPILSGVTEMSGMFNGATIFNGDIGGWDVRNVGIMGNMFTAATAFEQNLGRWYAAPNPNSTYGVGADHVVLTLAGQNSTLRGHSPTYELVSVNGETDATSANFPFTLTGGVLTVKTGITIPNNTYSVRVDVNSANTAFFGTANDFVVLSVRIEGTTITLPTSMPDLTGDDKVDNKDPLLAYYILTFQRFLSADATDDLTAALLKIFSEARNLEQYKATIQRINDWQGSPASDIDGITDVDSKDALLAYYMLTFRTFLTDDGRDDLTAALLGIFSAVDSTQYGNTLAAIDRLFPLSEEE